MGCRRENCLDVSPSPVIHKGRGNHREIAGVEKGLAERAGMRMLNYFINRAERNLSPSRRAELQRAKRLLSKRIRAKKNWHPLHTAISPTQSV